MKEEVNKMGNIIINQMETWGIFNEGENLISYEGLLIKELTQLLNNRITVIGNALESCYFLLDKKLVYNITKNGDELNIQRGNEIPLSIPYQNSLYQLLSPKTLAYRLYIVINDYSLANIDWNKGSNDFFNQYDLENKEYTIIVKEVLERAVTTIADSDRKAMNNIIREYENEDIVLDCEDFSYMETEIVSISK